MAKLKVDDPAWWRGMRMVVTAVEGPVFMYETVDALIEDPDWESRDGETKGRTKPAYILACNVADAKWDEEFGFWYLPGIAGALPKVTISAEGVAEYEDPDIPTCVCEDQAHEFHTDDLPHGMITFMLGVEGIPLCNSCRVANAKAAAEVA